MSVSKGFLLFGFSLLLTACFDAPKLSVTPQINFVNICFNPGTVAEPVESLVLTISFKDGDGDLGLSPTEIDDPYHDVFYGLASEGTVVELAKETPYAGYPQFVKVPPGVAGKLITTRTLSDPIYANQLPPFVDEFTSCKDYRLQTIYIREEDSHIIDNSYLDVDVLEEKGLPKIYVVRDAFYKKNNPKHDNIEVEFWVKGPGDQYTLFDWEKEYCETAFNQRFPRLAEKEEPLEGNLQYALSSLGIKASFSTQTLKLRIRIRDRAFNVSNEVETGDFTLDKISANCQLN